MTNKTFAIYTSTSKNPMKARDLNCVWESNDQHATERQAESLINDTPVGMYIHVCNHMLFGGGVKTFEGRAK